MTEGHLASIYRAYIECLNTRDWDHLGRHVGEAVRYNGSPVGLAGYRSMLEEDVRAIPDLRFEIALLVCDARHVASRLTFDCTPAGSLFGYPVNGRRVTFAENVIYEFDGGRIRAVWSIIDKSAIAAQL
jgi:predicted ester cyclase